MWQRSCLVWLEVICRDLTLIFLPRVGPLSSWWVWGVCLLLNKPHYIAGLTFGTWTSLLPHPTAGENNIRVVIWQSELSNYFSKPSSVVYYWAQHLRYARNRASHLEPLLDLQELQHFHRCAVRLLNALDPLAASWLAGQAFIPKVIAQRPLGVSKP